MRAKITSFEIKNSDIPLVSFVVKSHDLDLIKGELHQKLADMPDFFSGEPTLIDLSGLDQDVDCTLDLAGVKTLLSTYHLHPWAIKSQRAEFIAQAQHLGLVEISAFLPSHGQASKEPKNLSEGSSLSRLSPAEHEVQRVVEIREVIKEVPAEKQPAMLITKPLRSGQHVYARGGDLIILAMVNAGAEVMADGNVHVYAPLRGKAIAGAKGDTGARIFTSCLEAELVSIAGTYRTSDTALPKEVYGKSAQVFLQGDKLVMQKLD